MIIALHMEHRHVQHLGHDRVDFARHDRRPWLYRRQANLIQPRRRAAAQQAQVVGDASQGDGQRAHRCAEMGGVGHALHPFKQIVTRV